MLWRFPPAEERRYGESRESDGLLMGSWRSNVYGERLAAQDAECKSCVSGKKRVPLKSVTGTSVEEKAEHYYLREVIGRLGL